MITFNKKSWHYKFNKWATKQTSGPWINAIYCESICPYFWSTLWNITWVLILALIFYSISSIAGATFLNMTEVSSVDLSWLWLVGVGGIACVVALFLLVAVSVYFILEGKKKVVSKVFSKKEDGKTKEPNVFIEWLKAKKDKVCPMIEFKD